jgi:dipeptidyl-peptidase III
MRIPTLLAAWCSFSFGCASAPPVGPGEQPPGPPAPLSTPASATAPAKPAAAVPTVGAKVVAIVGDVTVASYPPTGFDRLTPAERALAYHLAMATHAGDPIFTMQSSRYAPRVQAVVRGLLAQKQKLPAGFAEKLLAYRRMTFIHHGIHDAQTGQKFLPPFTREELAAAATATGMTVEPDLVAGMFDPAVAPIQTNKTPGKGKDPIVESAANHYEGITSKDLARYKEKYELNGRLVKKKGAIVEEVYRAGGDGAPPGLAAAELARVVQHLEAAMTLAPPAQREALGHLVHYFQTGHPAAFREHDVAWLEQVFAVDYILGFIETYTDVRERKGGFEGFVAIRDPERDPPLQALARNAQYFEQKMPWQPQWKRESFRTPAAAAVTVVAAAGDAGPMTFVGVNLPNAQDVRQQYGSKNFVVLSVADTREELMGARTVDEFAPAEARAEIHRCTRWLEYAATGFHEVTGHGSGKVNAGLAGDPSKLLAPYYAAMEEARAELVADYLSGDPKTIEIGLLPDAGCAAIWPQYKTMMAWLRVKTVPEGDVAEEDHLRADLMAFGYQKDKGVITIEQREGETVPVVKDPVAWRKVTGELLAELQRIKATADKKALQALVEKYGSRINPAWRDEIVARNKALALPRIVATLAPMLTPIKDASGRVVDARAAQTTSLDDYIAMVERAGAP